MNIAIVGEAWGEKEAEVGRPFVGPSGFLLDQCLSMAGIDRRDCLVTNVFNLRPSRNDVMSLCGNKGEAIPNFPPLAKGKYVRREYAKELDRLYEEIRISNPNLILTLGATATWAFLHSSGIKSIRGAIAQSAEALTPVLSRTYKILPALHPAAVLREYSQRPVLIADIEKAARESATPDVIRPRRLIWTHPTLEDLATYERDYIRPATRLSIDIETKGDQITCIGFAPSPESCIVIPFFRGSSGNYWNNKEDELQAFSFVRRWCSLKPTVMQNGMYDMTFLWRKYGISVPLAEEDTMLLHHAWMPEMQKGLGFLATLYSDELSWKFMSKGKKHD